MFALKTQKVRHARPPDCHASPVGARIDVVDGQTVEVREYAPGASGGTYRIRPDYWATKKKVKEARLAEYTPFSDMEWYVLGRKPDEQEGETR